MNAFADKISNAENPWLGLRSYEEEDHSRFFGRSTAIADLMRIVRRNSLTVLYGVSGIGKTSLLCAGLFPLLRGEGFLPVRIRPDFQDPGITPVRQVIDCVEQEIERLGYARDVLGEPFGTEQETLWEYFHRMRFWSGVQPLTPVLVFDQFEEVFTLGSSDAASRERTMVFITELGDLIENQLPLQVRRRMEEAQKVPLYPYETRNFKVLIALREDYLPNLERLVPQIPSLSTPDRYALSAMNGNEALEAVLGPGKSLVDRTVAEQIVLWAAAAHQKGATLVTPGDPESEASFASLAVEPFLLSLFCRELCARMYNAALPRISQELVSTHQAAIIDEFYEECFHGLSRQIRNFVEEELVGQSGYREMVALEKAGRSGIAAEEWPVLVERRLVRIEDDPRGTCRVELIHDVLTKVVIQRREARYQEEARAEEEARRKEDEARRRARYRHFQFTTALFALFIIVASYLKMNSDNNKKIADKMQRIATAEKLATLASTKLRGSDPEKRLALEMALCAASLYKSAEETVSTHLEDTLRRVYLSQKIKRAPELSKAPIGFALRTGPTPMVATAKTLITFRNISKGAVSSPIMYNISSVNKKVHQLGKVSAPCSISFSPDGRYLASGGKDGIVQVAELLTGKKLVFAGSGHESPVRELVYSPDGKTIATGRADRTIILHEAKSLRERKFAVLDHDITGLAFSPANPALLAVSDGSGTVRLWDVRDTSRKTARKTFSKARTSLAAVTFSPSGESLAAAGRNGMIYIWDVAADKPAEPQILELEAPPVSAISFCKKGQLIAGAYADNMIRIWSISDKKVILMIPSFPDSPQKIAYLENGSGGSMIILDSKENLKLINLSKTNLEQDLNTVMVQIKAELIDKKTLCIKWQGKPTEWAKCLIDKFNDKHSVTSVGLRQRK